MAGPAQRFVDNNGSNESNGRREARPFPAMLFLRFRFGSFPDISKMLAGMEGGQVGAL